MTLRHPRGVLAVAALLLVVLGVDRHRRRGQARPRPRSTSPAPIPRAPTKCCANTSATRRPSRSCCAARRRRSTARGRSWSAPCAATRRSPPSRPGIAARSAACGPGPRRALILADFHVDVKTAVNDTVDQLNRILEEQVHAPVRATQTGYASLSRAIQDESISSSERGELIALPFLLLVLLLVFRSPIAAAIPLGFGAITVIASRGILYFFTSWFSIDAFALTVCTMMGLALGVDYALLMVSRFREELAAGAEPVEAARQTRRTAGRTTVFAGSTLLLSMLVSIFVLPGSLLASLAGTVAMVVVLSVAVATVVGPALLMLIGPNIDRWRIGTVRTGRSRLMVFVGAALKRPALVAALIGGVVLVLAAPAIGLKTGPPSTEQLPKDAPARKDAELIDSAIGPGWDAPFQIVAVSRDGPITDSKSLAALDRWQHRIAKLPGVQPVIGPGQAAKRVEPLQDLGNAALSSEGNIGPVKQLGRLGRSLGVAAGGVGQLRGGISGSQRRRRPAGRGLRPGRRGRAADRRRPRPGDQRQPARGRGAGQVRQGKQAARRSAATGLAWGAAAQVRGARRRWRQPAPSTR